MGNLVKIASALSGFALLCSSGCSFNDSDGGRDSGASTDGGADGGSGCRLGKVTQCGADGNVHLFDSCGNESAMVDDCPDQRSRCVELSKEDAACKCNGEWEGDECDICPGHWDPDKNCEACKGNWDPAKSCETCVAGWGGNDCSTLCARYVDANAKAGGDGLGWGRAFASVQAGIDSAYDKASKDPAFGACLVLVAKGTYYIYGSEWTDTVQLKPGVHLLGGFDGTEKSPDERDWKANATILDGGDGPDGGRRVSTVVTGSDNSAIDGFTVKSGSAWNKGGGMYNYRSSPIVANCVFEQNSASSCGGGGGMYNYHSSPVVTNCVFKENRIADDGCGGRGGGMLNESSSPEVINCVFSNNGVENGAGGGMYNAASSPKVTNCTFFGNFADEGGGMHNVGSSPVVTNCIFWGNEPMGIYDGGGSSASVAFSDLEGFYKGEGNIFSDPLFENEDPKKGPIDLKLQKGSPCIDAGNDEKAPKTDIDGNSRVDEPDVGANGAVADIGAYEYQGS